MIQNFNLSKKKQSVLPYLSFIGTDSFTLKTNNASKNWDGILEYSTDGTTWVEWNGTEISSINNLILLRGKNNSYLNNRNSESKKFEISTSGLVDCVGRIDMILDYEKVLNNEQIGIGNYCFAYLFSGCSALRTAPDIPLTNLSQYCYFHMFTSCVSLINAPELPATVLASYCYESMFLNCTSLISAPSLPANTLARECYDSMFYGCVNLESLPELPAVTLAIECYDSMFYGCSKIKISTSQTSEYVNEYRMPSQGTGTTASSALSSMFGGTGGTFTGTPAINTTYYTSNAIVPAS